jgi:hypothetical protein
MVHTCAPPAFTTGACGSQSHTAPCERGRSGSHQQAFQIQNHQSKKQLHPTASLAACTLDSLKQLASTRPHRLRSLSEICAQTHTYSTTPLIAESEENRTTDAAVPAPPHHPIDSSHCTAWINKVDIPVRKWSRRSDD